MPTDLMPAIDEDMPELRPGNGQGGGLPMPTETKIGDIVSMRRAAVLMPRQPAEVRRRIAEAAEMFGDSFDYKFPVRNRRTGQTDFIEGPTVSCAMTVARAYGNCDVAHTRTEEEGNAWIIYSTFLDLETGFSLTRGFRQRKNQASMGSDAGRAEDASFQIGVSKSTRNVVARALDDFVQYARQRARERLSGQIAKRPDEYRARIETYLGEVGYPLTAVEGAVGAKLKAWTPEQIATVVRTLTAHKDGILSDLADVYQPKGREDSSEAMPQSAATEASGRTAAPEQAKTAPEAPAPADEPLRQPAAPSKRPGRPTNEEIAHRIIEAVLGAPPDEVGQVLRDNAERLERLPEKLRTEVMTAANAHMALGDEEIGEPTASDGSGEDDEGGDTAVSEADAWLATTKAAIAGLPTQGHVRAYFNRYVNEASTYGDEMVEEVKRLLAEREAALPGPGK